MNPSTIKTLLGAGMAIAGVLVQFLPPQYQAIVITILGVLGGAHGLTSAVATDPPKDPNPKLRGV